MLISLKEKYYRLLSLSKIIVEKQKPLFKIFLIRTLYYFFIIQRTWKFQNRFVFWFLIAIIYSWRFYLYFIQYNFIAVFIYLTWQSNMIVTICALIWLLTSRAFVPFNEHQYLYLFRIFKDVRVEFDIKIKILIFSFIIILQDLYVMIIS